MASRSSGTPGAISFLRSPTPATARSRSISAAYGRSSKLWDPREYRISRLVADLIGVVHALGETTAAVVGHDWGAPVAWSAAWRHPEVFRAVVGLSVPFSGRGLIALPGCPFGDEMRPSEIHRQVAGEGRDFYEDYFATLGPIVDEIESDVRGWIRDAVFSFSGDALPPGMTAAEIARLDPVALIRASAACVPHQRRPRRLRRGVPAHGLCRRAFVLPGDARGLGRTRAARTAAGSRARALHWRRG